MAGNIGYLAGLWEIRAQYNVGIVAITFMAPASAQTTMIASRGVVFSAVLFCSHLYLMPGIAAAEIRMEPAVELLASYSDNVNLAPDGQQQDEWISQINPMVLIDASGNKANTNISYKMQNIIYGSDIISSGQEKSQIFHRLNADSRVDLMKDKVGVNISADYYQVNRPDSVIRAFDNLSTADYMINTAHLSVNPYLAYQLGDYSDIDLRYGYNRFDYSGRSILDGQGNEVTATIKSGKNFDRLLWGFDGRYSKTNYFRQPDIKLASAKLETLYKTLTHISVLVNAGYDSNRYQRQDIGAPTKGMDWSVGLEWNPSKRFKVHALKGRRYYGDTVSWLFTYYTKKSQTNIQYQEDIMTAANNLNNFIADMPQPEQPDELQNSTPADDGFNDDYNRMNPLATTEAFIRKRTNLDYSLGVKRSIFRVNAVYDNNLYLLSGNKEQVLNGLASWQWNLSAKTSAIFSEIGQYTKYRENRSKELTHRFSAALEIRVNKNMSARASYQYTRRYATGALSEYNQNYAELGLSVKF